MCAAWNRPAGKRDVHEVCASGGYMMTLMRSGDARAFEAFVRDIKAPTLVRMSWCGDTILELAARAFGPTFLAILLNSGKYDRSRDIIRRAFMCACENQRPDNMRLLLQTKCAFADYRKDGLTPLMILANSDSRGSAECASVYVAQKNVNAGARAHGRRSRTALMFAAQQANPELFDIILSVSVPYVDCSDDSENTALGISIFHKNTHARQRLLAVSGDRNVYAFVRLDDVREEWARRARWGFGSMRRSERGVVVRMLVMISARGFGLAYA